MMNNKDIETKRANQEYEKYVKIGHEINGSDVSTVINKAIEQNEKNNIPKDEKGKYIENAGNEVKIELKMVTVNKTFDMETIQKNGMANFMQNFALINFKCLDIEYHKETGLVKKIVLEEIEE